MAEPSWQVVRILGTILVLGPPVVFYVYRDTERRDGLHSLA